MKNHIHAVLFCTFIVHAFAVQAFASIDSGISDLQKKAITHNLWSHKEWLTLLHYRKDSGEENGYLSQVDDERFFNANDGKVNPKAELLATISSFYISKEEGDEHPQCRFVARLKWLKENLSDKFSDLPSVECKAYKKWRSIIPDEKVTLVFPAYHLNSPSSMFGHTLLRLDSSEQKNSSNWLSMAVNFGANVREGDNSLFYAFKGLSGGYPGFFIVTPYFEKIREYNYREKRDIWEYPLNLTAEESRKMIAHLWELNDIKFDYYFFDENCSYRLLELLEVARPGIDLTSEFELAAIPVDTVRYIQKAGMIASSHYRPSQVTVLESLLQQIDEKNRHYISQLSVDASLVNSSAFKNISKVEQKLIVDAAYKYLRYKKTGEERDEQSAKNSHQLLAALSTYPIGDFVKTPVPPSQPENGHNSKRLFVNIGEENSKKYTELGFRFSFHSLEDNVEGFLQGAQINLGSFQIRATENDSIKIQQFDVIDIFSLTPRTTLFKPLSWKIYTGMERQLTNGKDQLVAHVTGGAGIGYQASKNGQIYALLMGRLENNSGFKNTLEPALGVNMGMLYHFSSSTVRFELSGEEFSNEVYRYRGLYSQNIVLSRNQSIRLTIAREKQADIDFSEFNIAYQNYFF